MYSLDNIDRQLIGLLRSNAREPVARLTTTNGHWDMVIELQASSLAEFDEVLGRIRDISGIVSSETSILLSTVRTAAK